MLDAVAAFLLRTVGDFVLEVLLIGVFYWPGWLILRVLTLGKYPPPRPRPHNQYFVSCISLILALAGLTFYFS